MRALAIVCSVAGIAHAYPVDPLDAPTQVAPPVRRHTPVSWTDICVFALGFTDEDRVQLVPIAGTNIDGGLYRTTTAGFVTRYHATDTLIAILDTRVMFAHEREPMPAKVTSSPRQSAISVELGFVPLSGKFAVSDSLLTSFDVVASGGIGFVERADRVVFAAAYGATLRLRPLDWLTLELGVHDDYAGPWQAMAATPTTARTAMPTEHAIAPSAHDVEVRAGIGLWLPTRRHHRCRIRCG